MASGRRSCFSRAARSSLICWASAPRARHIRGLAEKIWKVLAPSSAAVNAAVSREPRVKVWMPRRRGLHRIRALERPEEGWAGTLLLGRSERLGALVPDHRVLAQA